MPTVVFTPVDGNGSGAAATGALMPGTVASITLTSGGTGYATAPTVTITAAPGDTTGTGATATAALTLTMSMQPKAIQELFTMDYGRMDALLGVEIPFTTGTIQTTISYGYIDPPEEIFKPGAAMAPIGTAADGTQIWKITHNGVDTHAIHFHMFDVQPINRVGWDGAVKPPAANEVGWKDTVRMNPLEVVFVAMRPVIPNLPWDIPNSVRLMDPTMPEGTSMQFGTANPGMVDPTGEPVTVTNQKINYGWEYVWHCHLLGHEENDMMHAVIVAVPPRAPSNLTVTPSAGQVAVAWTDNAINETGFTVRRATSPNGPWTTLTSSLPAAAGTGTTVTYNDTSVAGATTYYYQVIANNMVGYTQTYAAPAVGFPHTSADSIPVISASVTTP